MAEDPVSTISICWNEALVDYEVAKAAADAVADKPACQLREHIFEAYGDAAKAIEHSAAPDLKALVEKLHVYWRAVDLTDGSFGNSFRRKIVGDLIRLDLLLAGIDSEKASGGMDLQKVVSDWTEASREYDRCAQLRRDLSSESDVAALANEAQERMLSRPAPNLHAVEKKLTAIWADERFDPVSNSTAHCRILGDLRDLITQHQQQD